MNAKLALHIFVAGFLVGASFFLINPFGVWMPDDVHMLALGVVVILGGVFAIFVLAERSGDEREDAHRAFAGRVAFFAGAIALLVGITVQTFAHALDPWLVYALVFMVIAKMGARIGLTIVS